MAARPINEVFDALDEQTAVVPGTGTLAIAVPSLARSFSAVHEQPRALAGRLNALLEYHPLSPVLASMHGVGVRTAAVLLITVGDGSGFPTAPHLASPAGLSATTRPPGTPIYGDAPSGGRCRLKLALVLSARVA